MSNFRHVQRRKAQRERARAPTLNLVSMMDIFTILVFFLMVNSSEVEVLPQVPGIRLPESVAEQRPEQQLVISVGHDSLMVEGRPVVRLADLGGAPDDLIEPLGTLLAERVAANPEVPEGGFAVTILGDQEIPYSILKRIILTCQTADFARISLGVNGDGGAEA